MAVEAKDALTSTEAAPVSTPGSMLHMLAGPLVWAAHFAAVYFLQSMLCAIAYDHVSERPLVLYLSIAGITLVATMVLALLVVWREPLQDVTGTGRLDAAVRSTLRRISTWLVVLSAFGILAGAATALLIPVCASGR